MQIFNLGSQILIIARPVKGWDLIIVTTRSILHVKHRVARNANLIWLFKEQKSSTLNSKKWSKNSEKRKRKQRNSQSLQYYPVSWKGRIRIISQSVISRSGLDAKELSSKNTSYWRICFLSDVHGIESWILKTKEACKSRSLLHVFLAGWKFGGHTFLFLPRFAYAFCLRKLKWLDRYLIRQWKLH